MSVKPLLKAILNRIGLALSMVFLQANIGFSQPLEPVGIFEHHQDVGNPKLKGSVVYDKENSNLYRFRRRKEHVGD